MKMFIADFINSRHTCPICEDTIKDCKCLYSESMEKSKRRQVIMDHLYLFDKRQIRHLIALEKYWNLNYTDAVKKGILKNLTEKE